MVYIYSLPSEILQYPDVRNIVLKSYLKSNKINYKYVDYVDYLINNILYKNSKLKKSIEKIRNSEVLLTDANNEFVENFNKYLKKYNIVFNRKFTYKSKINCLDDLLKIGEEIKEFSDLFPIEKYKNEDIVFLGVHFGYQLPFAINIADRIKKKNSKVKVVLGGNYLTQLQGFSKEIIKRSDCVDSIILFGHCSTFLNLIKYYHGDKANLVNILNKDSDKYIINKNIEDDKKDYVLDYSDIDLSRYLSRKRIMPIILNYGCFHHKCTFCAHHFYFGNYMQLNTKNICKMILQEYKKNTFDVILFLDECIPTKQLFDFANFVISNNIKITWMIETRISIDFLNEKNVKLLYDSGLRFASFGIESYNQKVLDKMNKKIDKRIIKQVLNNFYNNGIIVSATFMIGYPGENILETYNTLRFINNCKCIDLLGLNPFQLVRNSIIAEDNKIEFDDINMIYLYDLKRNQRMLKIVHRFNNRKRFKNKKEIKSRILNRTDYFFINRNIFSINYKENDYEKEC